jgi:hypothetical protein
MTDDMTSDIRETGDVAPGNQPRRRELWEDSNTEDWGADNRSGRQKADAMLNDLHNGTSCSILGHTVKQMIEIGHYGGVEVGFFQRLAERLAAGD